MFGIRREALYELWPKGLWDIQVPLAKLLGLGTERMTDRDFWARIDLEGESFWSGLEPLPWFDELIQLVNTVSKGDWYILTSPSLSPESYSGKARWVKNRLGRGFSRLIPTKDKALLSGSNRVLIDDREETIVKWDKAGGMGLLFPTHLNSGHEAASRNGELPSRIPALLSSWAMWLDTPISERFLICSRPSEPEA